MRYLYRIIIVLFIGFTFLSCDKNKTDIITIKKEEVKKKEIPNDPIPAGVVVDANGTLKKWQQSAIPDNLIIKIPYGVKSIDSKVFMETKIRKVVIPASVEKIGFQAFAFCPNLEQVEIKEGLKEIGENAFYQCYSLKKVNIPASIKVLKPAIFNDCPVLEDVDLAEGLEIIGESMFAQCVNLKEIKLPSSLKKIGDNAFYKCSSLKEVFIPKMITEVLNSTFEDCTYLAKVDFANSDVSNIGRYAFANCKALKTINLPETLRTLHGGAFQGSGLQSITLPDMLEELQASCFESCSELKIVNFPKTLKFNKIGNRVFKSCISLNEVIIPDGITVIDIAAYQNCTSLEKLTLPQSIMGIKLNAFVGCRKLSEIRCLMKSPPALAGNPFKDSSFTLFVPSKYVKSYENANWTGAIKVVAL